MSDKRFSKIENAIYYTVLALTGSVVCVGIYCLISNVL